MPECAPLLCPLVISFLFITLAEAPEAAGGEGDMPVACLLGGDGTLKDLST